MRVKHNDDGSITLEGDGANNFAEILAQDEGRSALDDLSSEVVPLDAVARRTRLAALAARVERPRAEEQDEAFDTFLRFGKRALTPEQRAQSTDPASGGYLIPAGYEKSFIAATKAYDPILDIATAFSTPTAAAGDFPVDDDTVVGEIVAESGTSTPTDVAFGSLPLVKCPQHRSKLVRVPLELLQDAFKNFRDLIFPVLSARLARSVAAIAVARLLADSDTAVTTASPSAVTPSEILDLMGALDSAHSRVGAFLMNESTLTALKKQTAYTAGNYPNMVGTDPEGRATVFGKTVFSSPTMAALGSNAKAIAFGNFSRFYVRTVTGSLLLKSFPERFAEYGQTGFEMYWRAQGALAKGTNVPLPVRLLQCHS